MKKILISIIIPTLNEKQNILPLLKYLNQLNDNIELIVVDTDSRDRTVLQKN